MRTGLLAILTFLFSTAFAQSPHFNAVGERQEMPCNEIYDIFEDRDGYLWLGTEIGLYRYDGKGFQAMRSGNLSGRPVTGTAEVGNRKFAISFNSHVFEILGDSLHLLPISPDILPYNYPTLIEYNESLVLAGPIGIFQMDSAERWTQIYKSDKAIPEPCHNLQLFAENLYWTTGNEVWQYDGEQVKNIPAQFANPKADTALVHYHLNVNAYGVFIVNVWDGATFKLKDGRWEQILIPEYVKAMQGRKLTKITCIENNFYVLTFSGMVCLNMESQKVRIFYDGMPCTDLVRDREQTSWVSTLGYGLLQIPEFRFETYFRRNVAAGQDQINRVEATDFGVYYTGLSGDIGLVRAADAPVEYIQSPTQSDITCLSSSGSGGAVIALNNYLYVLEGKKLILQQGPTPPVKDFIGAKDGTIYFAASSGLYMNKRGTFAGASKLHENWFRVLSYSEENKELWAGSVSGLYRISEDKVADSFLIGQMIGAVAWMPSTRKLYVVSQNNRLHQIAGKEVESINLNHSNETQIYNLSVHGDYLYMATSQGLEIYNTRSKAVKRFRIQDGLASNMVYDLCIYENRIWLATSKGLQVLPLFPQKKRTKPVFYLHQVNIQERPVNPFAAVNLKKGDEIQISLDILSYASMGEYHIEYSLDTNHWEKVNTGQTNFNTRILQTGRQIMYIRVKDYNGHESDWMRIPLKVIPPFWETPAFFVVLIIGSMVLMGLISLIYLANVKRKQRNALEKAQLKANVIESQLTALKAQMNPHFIFNSLNSIYELIILSDPKEAASYLNKFASLLRKVLENSEKERISLLEECEWLGLYLELEKLRFGSDFSYQIDLQEVKDPYDIMMPTMLLQPFVENAVKHGLLHKEGIKRLDIEFKEDKDVLYCIVRDNGVGRDAAEKFKMQRKKDHKSFATQAIYKRVEMLNSSHKFHIQVAIRDLHYPDDSPAGTEVELRIDLN
ncbi:MAG: hypothetical protein EP332_14990 [Bacteroidetes bacterium]|nr:MAG: hypothetical protein EP332_14990 [Bacteroidota bacterium]